MSLKAFTLVSAIEKSQLLAEKRNLQISSLEVCGKNLYLGTDDGYLLHYLLEEKHGNRNDNLKFECSKQGQTFLEVQKPVTKSKATTGLKRILALCDSTIFLLNMLNLELLPTFKIKLVKVFTVNKHPARSDPFSIEVCVGTRKKSIQIYNVRDDHWVLLKEFQLNDFPVALKVDGSIMCVGLLSEYKMINYESGHQQDLFEFDSKQVLPVVVHISKDEYLLSASNALGVFALSEGISHRPPLQWINNIITISYVYPYVVVLNDEFITVHSVLDQQQKQTMQFSGGISVGEFDGKIFVTTKSDVYCLLPEPVDRQIQSLLVEHRISEALDLAKNACKCGKLTEDFDKTIKRIEQQAGFVEFSKMNFEEALKHFSAGNLDPRELISLYPELLPTNSDFVRFSPPLHDIVSVRHLSSNKEKEIEGFQIFLFDYLKQIYDNSELQEKSVKNAVNTAYLKLLCKFNSSEILKSISKFKDCFDVESCVSYFKLHKNYHCSALALSIGGNNEAALDIWKKICDHEIEDRIFPGFNFVIDFLSKSTNVSLIWKFSDWFMAKDQQKAVAVFISQCDVNRMDLDVVIDYLSGFENAAIFFLEHIILKKNSQVSKYHSHLASLYFDQVSQLKDTKNINALEKARKKLCHFLKVSDCYKVHFILGKIKNTDLHHECALLHGKLEEHETALNILADKLENFEAAEDYCKFFSQGRPSSYRSNLFQTLLCIYLNARNFKEQYLKPAVALLNKHQHEFDAVKVLQAVPGSWSNALIENFLMNSVRGSLNKRRTTKIQVMLAKGRDGFVKRASISPLRGPVIVTEERSCSLCNRPFNDPVFVSFPQGDNIVHVHCQQNAALSSSIRT